MAALLSATVLAGCSQQPTDAAASDASEAVAPATGAPPAPRAAANEASTADAAAPDRTASPDAAAIPGTDVAVGSGVAFTYSFDFRLADDQVTEAQDRHLRACERLGASRCQVTDILFDREDNGPIDAHLSFLLDPALARGFARDAVDTVEALDGSLTSSNVRGEELARGIEDSQATSARLGGDIARLERRLAAPGLAKNERDDIQAQLNDLRGETTREEQGRRSSETRLASTPVRFDYTGNTGIAGIDTSRPFSSAWAASTNSLGSATAFLLTLIGILLPWALMIGGAVFGIRWLVRRLSAAKRAAPAVDVPVV